ncbi:DUF2732 family protein [Klebsiella pneumoniae]|nr:DUF2732 domain-containing protein [Klebsiella aerogenes]HCB9020962.1 DUF2732 domain-containing protein [Klebsiella pneumoniae]HDK6673062.1 DUF2732 domain-containing protein [Klebsiella pneumoniae]
MHKQTLEPKENTDMLLEVIGIAKHEERKGRALAVSIRLEALATHITNKGLNAIEAAELLRREATRYENESQELH